jgi:hypothetical protein
MRREERVGARSFAKRLVGGCHELSSFFHSRSPADVLCRVHPPPLPPSLPPYLSGCLPPCLASRTGRSWGRTRQQRREGGREGGREKVQRETYTAAFRPKPPSSPASAPSSLHPSRRQPRQFFARSQAACLQGSPPPFPPSLPPFPPYPVVLRVDLQPSPRLLVDRFPSA